MKKRFSTFILTIVLIAGVFAPVVPAFVPQSGVGVHVGVAIAHADDVDKLKGSEASPATQLGSCSIADGGDGIVACLAWIAYQFPYRFGVWVLGLSGQLFDATASITLSTRLYSATSFIQDGWRLTRDFSNIFFILILLYIALALVLDIDIGHSNPKSLLASVVLVALFINFSMFLTQVVIDTSNTLALLFYNQIQLTTKDGKSLPVSSNPTYLGEEARPIGVAISAAFRPQLLNSTPFYNCLANSGGDFSATCKFTTPTDKNAHVSPGVIFVLLVIAGILFLMVAYAFLLAAFSFMGRLIQLWILIILSPLAFMSYIIPSMRGMKGFGWRTWTSTLVSTAFMAPILFFFLLLIGLLSQSQFIPNNLVGNTINQMLLAAAISFFILYILLKKAVEFAKSSAGELGTAMINLGTGALKFAGAAVGGAAIGVGAGAASFAGRNIVGRLSQRINEGTGLRQAAKEGGIKGWSARQAILATERLSKSSFDVRQNALANALSKSTGMNMGSIGALSTQASAGGWQGVVARETAKDLKWKDRLGENKEGKKAIKGALEQRENDIDEKEVEIARVKAITTAQKALEEIEKRVATNPLAVQQKQNDVAKAKAAVAEAMNNASGITKSQAILEKELTELKNGKLKAERRKAGQEYTDTNGKKYTATKEDAMADMGKKDLEKAVETAEKSLFIEYLANKAKRSGYAVHSETDALGNMKEFHTSSKQLAKDWWKQSWQNLAIDSGSKVALGAAIGTAIAGPVGTAVGASMGALTQLFRESVEIMGGGGFGTRSVWADAAHHASEKNPHTHAEHSKYKAGDTGFVKALREALKSGGGGGGGGHDHGHDDHGHGGGGHH